MRTYLDSIGQWTIIGFGAMLAAITACGLWGWDTPALVLTLVYIFLPLVVVFISPTIVALFFTGVALASQIPYIRAVAMLVRLLWFPYFLGVTYGTFVLVFKTEQNRYGFLLCGVLFVAYIGLGVVFPPGKLRQYAGLIIAVVALANLARMVAWPSADTVHETGKKVVRGVETVARGKDTATRHQAVRDLVKQAQAVNEEKEGRRLARWANVLPHIPDEQPLPAPPTALGFELPKPTRHIVAQFLENQDGRFDLTKVADSPGWQHYTLTTVEGDTGHVVWKEGAGKGTGWIVNRDGTRDRGEAITMRWDENCCHDGICEGTPCWVSESPSHGQMRLYP
ncbi:MAG TPA: hypothetical protein VJB98_04110 [Candidatus Paceibacterota bacterium]